MRERKFRHIGVLGITGGVGAGKSTVLSYLKERYGALIIECDQVGKDLQKKGGACYEPMIRLFGKGIIGQDGEIDRPYVAKRIFREPEKKAALEKIVLPAVKAEVRQRLEELDQAFGTDQAAFTKSWKAGDPGGQEKESVRLSLAVIESAILLDDHYDEFCDEIWYIYTSDEKRRERLKASRGYSDERIDRMFAAQRSDLSFREHTQFVIDNSSDIVQNTFEQIERGMKGRKFGNLWISAQ